MSDYESEFRIRIIHYSYRIVYISSALLGTPPSEVFFECLYRSNVYVSLISQ